MQRWRPELLALGVALIGAFAVLAGFFTDMRLSRTHDLRAAQNRLTQTAAMLAEHSARSLQALDIVLSEIASDLAQENSDWRQWPEQTGHQYVTRHHSRLLPQLRDLILFDEGGSQRFISTYFPTPRINVRDRGYFQALLSGGQELATWGPYVGRNSGRYTYALARRLVDRSGGFTGVVFTAVESAYFQDFCWAYRLADDFDAALINRQGVVVAYCRPSDLSARSEVLGQPIQRLLAGQRLPEHLPATGSPEVPGWLVSIAPVPAFDDLRIIAALPEGRALVDWRVRLFQLSVLAVLVAVMLLVGGVLVWRQNRELSETARALAEHEARLTAQIAEATAEIARQREEAIQASTAKSRFLAAASHDLRQPLHALSLFAADLQRRIRSGEREELPRLAEQIKVSAGLLGELLDSLLDISRLDVNGIVPVYAACPLQTLFDHLNAAFRRSAQSKGVALIVRPSRAVVQSDRRLLERLLANLLANAIRYTPQGGCVLVCARPAGKNHWRVEVRDNGIGIAAEHQAAIFGEFYQVGNRARQNEQGLGLGLSIVDRVARSLGAPLSLRSRLGEGTTFGVLLPEASLESSSKTGAELAPRLVFLGERQELAQAAALAAQWDLPGVQVSELTSLGPAEEAVEVWVTDAAGAQQLAALGLDLERLVIVGEVPPEFSPEMVPAHVLGLPLRPAKLRAMLEQLLSTRGPGGQKTSAKLMP